MKINGQNIDGIIIYKRKYNFEMVARKLIDLGYQVAEPTDGFDLLIYDQDRGGWIGQFYLPNINTISWEIFLSYDTIDIEINNKSIDLKPPVDNIVAKIAHLFETNEFMIKARKLLPNTTSTEDMMAELGKQIYNLINK
jgi:hypothetical protein